MSTARLRSHRRFATVGLWCATLLVLLLPALVAGTRLAAPPAAGEVERLEGAVGAGPAPAASSVVARLFLVAALAPGPPPQPGDGAALLGRARLAQLGGLLGIGLLVYLLVLVARGRLLALLATAALAALPPVAASGYVLRPETAAILLALLAVLLLQCGSQAAPRRSAARRWRRGALAAGLLGCALLANALAVATLPAVGFCLLLPAAVLLLGTAQALVRSWRLLRRRGLARLPVRAWNWRLLPWTLAVLLTPVVALWVSARAIHGPAAEFAASPALAPLLPAGGALRWLCIGIAAAGALAAVVRTGLRFGRTGRIGPDLVLLAFAAISVAAAAMRREPADALPLAPAAAILLAEGAFAALVAASGALGYRARSRRR